MTHSSENTRGSTLAQTLVAHSPCSPSRGGCGVASVRPFPADCSPWRTPAASRRLAGGRPDPSKRAHQEFSSAYQRTKRPSTGSCRIFFFRHACKATPVQDVLIVLWISEERITPTPCRFLGCVPAHPSHLDELFPGDAVRADAVDDFGEVDATRQSEGRFEVQHGGQVVIATRFVDLQRKFVLKAQVVRLHVRISD